MTITLNKVKRDIGSISRLLEHHKQARLARKSMMLEGLTVEQLADKASLHKDTVYRFIGVNSNYATKDPRTSTTRKVFEALGYTIELRPHE